jgi:pimeloyl-ACP methyl ester carboxylesterase
MNVLARTACAVLLGLGVAGAVEAACVDNVVLVHGNVGQPSNWNNTYNELLARGYSASQIYRPSWGSKICAACNDHYGSEETPVATALTQAKAASCTGKIDVIGHSMGVTLAAREINKLGLAGSVQTFVGIAGGVRGLWSCGTYPFNVPNSTCGAWGLSVGNPFVNGLQSQSFGIRKYSIKSWIDEIACSTGFCTVGGVHTSTIPGENGTYSFALGHLGLQSATTVTQVNLIQ